MWSQLNEISHMSHIWRGQIQIRLFANPKECDTQQQTHDPLTRLPDDPHSHSAKLISNRNLPGVQIIKKQQNKTNTNKQSKDISHIIQQSLFKSRIERTINVGISVFFLKNKSPKHKSLWQKSGQNQDVYEKRNYALIEKEESAYNP